MPITAPDTGTCTKHVPARITAADLAGTYRLTSSTVILPDGLSLQPFGTVPLGQCMLDPHGRFTFVYLRSDLAPFEGKGRLDGTLLENTAIVHGSIAAFGRYAIEDRDLLFTHEGCTYPNWIGYTHRHAILSLGQSQLTWTTPASGGGMAEVSWQRLP